NSIFTDTKAYIANSEVQSKTSVDINASNTASVEALILAASVAAAGGGTAGVGASIGISIAQNTIGDTSNPAEVLAYIENSTVNAQGGALTIDATGNEIIEALVIAGSAAIAGGGTVGVGFSGAGVFASNVIVD